MQSLYPDILIMTHINTLLLKSNLAFWILPGLDHNSAGGLLTNGYAFAPQCTLRVYAPYFLMWMTDLDPDHIGKCDLKWEKITKERGHLILRTLINIMKNKEKRKYQLNYDQSSNFPSVCFQGFLAVKPQN